MSDIPSISELLPCSKFLGGDKVKITTILNVPIIVLGWQVLPSTKKKGTSYVKLQFVRVGEEKKQVVNSSSDVLIDQIGKIEAELDKRGLPHKFRTTIRQIDDYFKFIPEDEEEEE